MWIPKGDVLVRGQCLFKVKCLLEEIRYAMRWNIASHSQFYGKSLQTETTTWSEFPNGVKAVVKQILASEERTKKKHDCESHSLDLSRKVNQLKKVVWGRKITNKVH